MTSPVFTLDDFASWRKSFKAACERSRQKAREQPAPVGYSSWEEYDRLFRERSRQYEKSGEARLQEEADETGKTLREVCKEWYGDQMESTRSNSPACGCEGELLSISSSNVLSHLAVHNIPLFCPEALVDFRSQDLPEYLSHIQQQHRLQP